MPEPKLSVLLEGYNDSLDLGRIEETLTALAGQDFPLKQMEVLVAGTAAQMARLEPLRELASRFARLEFIPAPGAHYYQLKNIAADAARGQYLGFIDSDVLPDKGWAKALAAALDGGAGAVAGLSGFRAERGHGTPRALLACAAAVSWGFVLPRNGGAPRGILSHNFGIRREAFQAIRYREDLGRTCAGSFLLQGMRERGVSLVFSPEMRTWHLWSAGWWTLRLHVRFGHEIYLLRRIDEKSPFRWLRFLALLEPLLVCGRQWLGDFGQWLRYARWAGFSRLGAWLLLPLAAALSALARGSQLIGMYGTLVAPGAMRAFALRN